jgi:hypothetical protein
MLLHVVAYSFSKFIQETFGSENTSRIQMLTKIKNLMLIRIFFLRIQKKVLKRVFGKKTGKGA